MTEESNQPAPKQRPATSLDSFEQQHGPEVDVELLHAAVYREKTDPKEGKQPVPIWLILSSFALLMWGGWYLGSHSADFAGNRYEGPSAFKYDSNAAVVASAPVVDPMLFGKRIYNNCSACHQANGAGAAGQFPPLDGSKWVTGRDDNLARILLQGLVGPIEVGGKIYNGNMPKWSHLDDRDLAAVLTYIRGSWSNNAPPVATELVAAVREATSGRAAPWTAEQLLAAPIIAAKAGVEGEAEPDENEIDQSASKSD